MILNKTSGFHILLLTQVISLRHQVFAADTGNGVGEKMASRALHPPTHSNFISVLFSVFPTVLYIRLHTHLLGRLAMV